MQSILPIPFDGSWASQLSNLECGEALVCDYRHRECHSRNHRVRPTASILLGRVHPHTLGCFEVLNRHVSQRVKFMTLESETRFHGSWGFHGEAGLIVHFRYTETKQPYDHVFTYSAPGPDRMEFWYGKKYEPDYDSQGRCVTPTPDDYHEIWIIPKYVMRVEDIPLP